MAKRQCFQVFKVLLICNYFLIAVGCSKDDSYYLKVTDIEGNAYKTVVIGNQRWMAENLKTTIFNDGTSIGVINDSQGWIYQTETSEPYGCCFYDNDEYSNGATYGVLYNWYAVNSGKNLCPTGWHVANEDDWTTLINFLGGTSMAGGKLKETGTAHWQNQAPNTTNESGFTALPGGIRLNNGNYVGIKMIGNWWSAEKSGIIVSRGYELNMGNPMINIKNYDKRTGLSVRCIED